MTLTYIEKEKFTIISITELKKKSAVGLDACNCPVQTCVDQKLVCDKEKQNDDYGDMFFRNEKYSGVHSTEAMTGEVSLCLCTPNLW